MEENSSRKKRKPTIVISKGKSRKTTKGKVVVKRKPKSMKVRRAKIKAMLKTKANMEPALDKMKECLNPLVFDKSFKDRVSMDNKNDAWVMNDRRVFPEFIDNFSRKVDRDVRRPLKVWDNKKNSYSEIQAYRHQKFVSDYLSDNSPYRGLLLFHGLGSGKSGASITISEGFRGKRIVVMLPYSLKQNYEDEIATFGDIAYRKSYHWCFIPLDYKQKNEVHNAEIYRLMESKGLEKNLFKTIITKRSNGDFGIWLIDITKKQPNYVSLSEELRTEIDNQIEKLYKYKYSFVHYNAGAYVLTQIFKLIPNYDIIKAKIFGGHVKDSKLSKADKDTILNHIYDPSKKVENPFNNKVVVIDEIHNLSSMMVGSGFNGPRIYELLMRAENCKLVLLSGTPIINHAYELALIANMLRGFINSTVFKIITSTKGKDLENLLSSNLYINRFEVKNGNEVEIVRNPNGFVNKYNISGEKIGIVKDIDIGFKTNTEF